MLLVATSCQVARPGARCRSTGFAQDTTHVLGCRNGRWTRVATKVEVAQRIAAQIRLNEEAAARAAMPTAPAVVAPAPSPSPPSTRPDDTYAPNDSDPAFGVGGLTTLHSDLALRDVVAGPGGTILVVFQGRPSWPWRATGRAAAIVRLLPDGRVDESFGTDGWWRGDVGSVTVGADGRPAIVETSWWGATRAGSPSVDVQVTERVVRKLTANGREVTQPVPGVDVWRWSTGAELPSIERCDATIHAVGGDLYVLFPEQREPRCSPTGIDRIDAAGRVHAGWGVGGPVPSAENAPLAVGRGHGGGVVVGDRNLGMPAYLIDAAGRYDPSFVAPSRGFEDGALDEVQVATADDGTAVVGRSFVHGGIRITTHDRTGAHRSTDPARPLVWGLLTDDGMVVHGNRILVADRHHTARSESPVQPAVHVLRLDRTWT